MEHVMRVRESFIPLVDSVLHDKSEDYHVVSFGRVRRAWEYEQRKASPLDGFYTELVTAIRKDKLASDLEVSSDSDSVRIRSKSKKGNEILKKLYGWKIEKALRESLGEKFQAWYGKVQQEGTPLHPSEFRE